MKKVIVLALLIFSLNIAKSQIVNQMDISEITTDTTFFFDKADTKYNTSLGLAVVVSDLVGTGGTYEYINSYSDTVNIYNAAISYTITKDTIYAIGDTYIPFSYVGLKITKGSMTAGTITTIIERKTRK